MMPKQKIPAKYFAETGGINSHPLYHPLPYAGIIRSGSKGLSQPAQLRQHPQRVFLIWFGMHCITAKGLVSTPFPHCFALFHIFLLPSSMGWEYNNSVNG